VSQFEYVAVLVSIIVGLALTQILKGVGRMVGDDQRRPTSLLGSPRLDALLLLTHWDVLVVGISSRHR